MQILTREEMNDVMCIPEEDIDLFFEHDILNRLDWTEV